VPGISVSDPDAYGAVVLVSLSVEHGTLLLNDTAPGGVTAAQMAGNGTSWLVLLAPLVAINASLGDPIGLDYFPLPDYSGPDTLIGPFGDSDTVAIAVTPVNDAPEGADRSVSTPADVPYTFAIDDFGFSDPEDDPANAFAGVKIAGLPQAGSLRRDGQPVGV